MVLGIKPRVSHVPGKCSSNDLHIQLLDLLGGGKVGSLGFEVRDSHLQSKCSTGWITFPALVLRILIFNVCFFNLLAKIEFINYLGILVCVTFIPTHNLNLFVFACENCVTDFNFLKESYFVFTFFWGVLGSML
jgi:hypothetical protein